MHVKESQTCMNMMERYTVKEIHTCVYVASALNRKKIDTRESMYNQCDHQSVTWYISHVTTHCKVTNLQPQYFIQHKMTIFSSTTTESTKLSFNTTAYKTLWSSRTRQLPYSHVKMTFVFNNYVNIVQYWTCMYIAVSKKVSPDKALDKAIVRILSQQCVKEHCNHRNVPLQQSCGIVTWKSLARKNPRRMKHMMNRTKTIKVHVKVSAVSPKDKTDRTHC